MKRTSFFLPILGLLLAACSPTTPTRPPTTTPAMVSPTATLQPTSTLTLTLVPTQTPTPNPSAGFVFSSPLQDIQLSELDQIISNPFELPAPGMDDGHHGVDFSYYARGTHIQMEGLEVYAVMTGKVAGVIDNRKPYGSAIIIETPLNTLPSDFLAALNPPQQATPYPYNPRLYACEALKGQSWVESPTSIYVLYAHMENPVTFTVGDSIHSGDFIGRVGNTGASGNPHLHLEMRWGPGGTEFASMSHYDGGATDSERLEYCTWRISGRYILIDPMKVIHAWLAR